VGGGGEEEEEEEAAEEEEDRTVLLFPPLSNCYGCWASRGTAGLGRGPRGRKGKKKGGHLDEEGGSR